MLGEEEKNEEGKEVRKHRVGGTDGEDVRSGAGYGSGKDVGEGSEETKEKGSEEDGCRMPVT